MPHEPSHSESEDKNPSEKRLVILQIDGLSRHQLERALRGGRMSYTNSLLKKQSHTLKTFYPGQPTSTPAVQAEIFFGVPAATPAFSFYDAENRKDVRMYDAEWARRIAVESSQHTQNLLDGGSSYANIYTGGAKKAKYCGELNTFDHWVSELSVLRLFGIAIKKPISALRVLALLMAELWIAIYDAIKGMISRGDIIQELKFIPSRLGVAIALREAIRGEVLEDMEEGLPIIHANFFGYDEAAHRRGPQARFAHWSLTGIDRTIRDIVEAGKARGYECIIFSDHGQEYCKPYVEEVGASLHATTERLFCKEESFGLRPEDALAAFMERSKKVASGVLQEKETPPEDTKRWIHVHAMGPVAHVYVDGGLSAQEKAAWAKSYCLEGHVPIAIYKDALEDIVCRIGEQTGTLVLLQEALIRRGHEFAEQTVRDIETVLGSRYAGELALFGWRSKGKPLTFAEERGSHAGPGAEECRGFVMLPSPDDWSADWMRPVDLRTIALRKLGRQEEEAVPATFSEPPRPKAAPLRIATYNVHGGVGVDRRRDTRRLASVVKELIPDVVCFQEAFEGDSHGLFSLRRCVSEHWEPSCHYEFLRLHQRGNIRYGLAIASKRPYKFRKSEAFEIEDARISRREPRGAIWIEIDDDYGDPIQIVNTHFGLNAVERRIQAEILLGKDWLGSCAPDDRIVLVGDFNAGPNSSAYRSLAEVYHDAQLVANKGRAAASFLSWAPLRRIDHIFTSHNFRIPVAGVFRSRAARSASDHLPVFADMEPLHQ